MGSSQGFWQRHSLQSPRKVLAGCWPSLLLLLPQACPALLAGSCACVAASSVRPVPAPAWAEAVLAARGEQCPP